jgi:L-rhamnose mutarotase
METIQFSILINADKRKVWNTMLDEKTYREWTKEFHEGSYYEGNWNKGSEIRFIALDDKGAQQGMFSRIKDNIEYQFISIEHLGLINNGIVDTTSEEVKKWAPSFENYTFVETGNATTLKIEMQVETEYKSMFEEMWPRALNALKKLCEQ